MSKERPSRNELIWALRDLVDDDLSSTQHHILMICASCVNDDYRLNYSHSAIARISRYTEGAVKKNIRKLSNYPFNYLILTKKGGINRSDPNEYQLNIEKIVSKTSYTYWSYKAKENISRGVPRIPLGGFLKPPRGVPKTPEALKAEALPKSAASRVLGGEEKAIHEKLEEERKRQQEWEQMTTEQRHEILMRQFQK